MGLFKANSCRLPYWEKFINTHEATWLPATFDGNQTASKLPGVWWPLYLNPASQCCIEFCSAQISGGVQQQNQLSIPPTVAILSGVDRGEFQ